MQILVEQVLHIFLERRHMSLFFQIFLKLVGELQLNHPKHQNRRNNKACYYACKKDLLGIIALDIFIYLFCFVPNFFLCSCTKRRHHRKCMESGIEHKEVEGDLAQKNQNAFDDLFMADHSQTHYNSR